MRGYCLWRRLYLVHGMGVINWSGMRDEGLLMLMVRKAAGFGGVDVSLDGRFCVQWRGCC